MDRLIVKNDLAEIKRLADAVQAFAMANRLPDEKADDLRLVVEETVTNIIQYGFEDDKEHQILVSFSYTEGLVSIEIEDEAKPFNPLKIPAPNLELDFDQRDVGGMGFHLVRSLMDNVEYRFQNGKNILTMKKLCDPL